MEVEKFSPSNLDLLNLQKSSYFSDVIWAITEGKPTSAQSPEHIKKYIMSTKSVKEAIEKLIEEQMKKLEQGPTAYQKLKDEYYKAGD